MAKPQAVHPLVTELLLSKAKEEKKGLLLKMAHKMLKKTIIDLLYYSLSNNLQKHWLIKTSQIPC